MIYFRSDYSGGAHPHVMEALLKTNGEQTDGYGRDEHTEHAVQIIKDLIGRQDCSVHMMIGGTPANITTAAAALNPYEAAVALKDGHMYIHECGALEACGNRIITVDGFDGKLTPASIEQAWLEFVDEATVFPKLAYISQPTESGTLYSKEELIALRKACDDHDMFLYLDGARLGAALTSEANDVTIQDIAGLVDAFYIGGTKNGLLMGEAMVIFNERINRHYRWMMKQKCGLLAKGRILGVQFEALLEGGEDSVFYQIGRHENKMAKLLREGIAAAGYSFEGTSKTNQIFPVLPEELVRKLEKDFFFYEWAPAKDGYQTIRLVTSWTTTEEDVNAFLDALK